MPGTVLACLLAGCAPHATTPADNTAAAPAHIVRAVEPVAKFPYPAGTVLAAHASKGKFSLVKVLRVERLKTDDSHNGTVIIHFRTYDDLFPSLPAAKQAVQTRQLKVRVASGTATADFLQHGVQRIATVPVTDAELDGYRKWRKQYEAGAADAFPM